jgi:hypothetical protein
MAADCGRDATSKTSDMPIASHTDFSQLMLNELLSFQIASCVTVRLTLETLLLTHAYTQACKNVCRFQHTVKVTK